MKKLAMEELFRKMRHCPMCGGAVTSFTPKSDLKTCESACGVMYLRGWQTDTKVGMFLEISEENLPQ